MKMKLMLHMRAMNGRALIVYVLCALFFNGCILFDYDQEDKPFDFVNTIKIKNHTLDTLVYNVFGGGNEFYSSINIRKSIIYPDSTLQLQNGSMIGEDPLEEYLEHFNKNDSCWVFYFDSFFKEALNSATNGSQFLNSVAVAWDAPLRSMGSDVHHYYNRDSWSVILLKNDDNYDEYHLTFTIEGSDLNVSKD